MKDKLLRFLKVEPVQHPKEIYVKNDIVVFHEHIMAKCAYCSFGIGVILLEPGVYVLRNEYAALMGKKGNRFVNDEIVAGTFFVVGVDKNNHLTSLTDKMIEKYRDRFWNKENYTDAEVEDSFWNAFEKASC